MRFLIIIALLLATTAVFYPRGSFGQGVEAPADNRVEPQIPAAEQEKNFFVGLQDFYFLGLSLVGLSALLMMVWGGIDYITAGDNTSRVDKGKERIRNALYGILVAGLSYALLYTINPNLVKFRIGNVQDYQK
ncbi:MAG: hypothetical protein HYT40_00420 [Candidatus Sungbacteria bacterium]|uniref:Uncharacterized protein n=1 Tax=Candidatus Sungiibacteriota bacterium TaxID=2750080 RepID=A0A931WNT4_9BACT|nr:hypothetical protein [Candidatus Sungbacteria bacterium]